MARQTAREIETENEARTAIVAEIVVAIGLVLRHPLLREGTILRRQHHLRQPRVRLILRHLAVIVIAAETETGIEIATRLRRPNPNQVGGTVIVIVAKDHIRPHHLHHPRPPRHRRRIRETMTRIHTRRPTPEMTLVVEAGVEVAATVDPIPDPTTTTNVENETRPLLALRLRPGMCLVETRSTVEKEARRTTDD
jgi:hypothetical protein